MPSYLIPLTIDEQELARYYRGQAANVRARSTAGAVVQFPAAALRPFVDHTGIHGLFELRVDRRGRLQSIRRC